MHIILCSGAARARSAQTKVAPSPPPPPHSPSDEGLAAARGQPPAANRPNPVEFRAQQHGPKDIIFALPKNSDRRGPATLAALATVAATPPPSSATATATTAAAASTAAAATAAHVAAAHAAAGTRVLGATTAAAAARALADTHVGRKMSGKRNRCIYALYCRLS